MYMYDTMQIMNSMPLELLQEVDITLIEKHGYNQTTEKQKATKYTWRPSL